MTQKRRKRVLFLVPSLARGGAETQVIGLANALDPSRFEKHLFIFEKPADQLDRLDRGQVCFYHHPRQYKFDFSMVPRIAEVIDAQAIDVIHCTLQNSLFMGWLGRLMAKRKPHLVSAIHRTVARDRKQVLQEYMLYQWAMRSCKKVICVCKNQEKYWHKSFPFLRNKTRVIYNGVDPVYFEPNRFKRAGQSLRESLGISMVSRVVTNIAGFRVEKNHTGLLEAFLGLDGEALDLYLLLAGDGPERPNVEKIVAQSGSEKRVKFLGNVEDVRPLLAASELTVIASNAIETFSIAMLESMAMGCPVVTTAIGGQPEAVENGVTGQVVSVNRPQELGDAIASCLMARPHLEKMSANARESVVQRFSKNQMVREIQDLIEEVCES